MRYEPLDARSSYEKFNNPVNAAFSFVAYLPATLLYRQYAHYIFPLGKKKEIVAKEKRATVGAEKPLAKREVEELAMRPEGKPARYIWLLYLWENFLRNYHVYLYDFLLPLFTLLAFDRVMKREEMEETLAAHFTEEAILVHKQFIAETKEGDPKESEQELEAVGSVFREAARKYSSILAAVRKRQWKDIDTGVARTPIPRNGVLIARYLQERDGAVKLTKDLVLESILKSDDASSSQQIELAKYLGYEYKHLEFRRNFYREAWSVETMQSQLLKNVNNADKLLLVVDDIVKEVNKNSKNKESFMTFLKSKEVSTIGGETKIKCSFLEALWRKGIARPKIRPEEQLIKKLLSPFSVKEVKEILESSGLGNLHRTFENKVEAKRLDQFVQQYYTKK